VYGTVIDVPPAVLTVESAVCLLVYGVTLFTE